MTNPLDISGLIERLITLAGNAFPNEEKTARERTIDEAAEALQYQAIEIERLREALEQARLIVASDAEACRAFAAVGEPLSEPEHVLKIIEATLARATLEKKP